MFTVKHVWQTWEIGGIVKGRVYHFPIPMIYTINLKGINHKNEHHDQYPDVPSSIRPIPHDPDFPVPKPDDNIEYCSDSNHSDMTILTGDYVYKPKEDDQPLHFTKAKLHNLTWDLNLSKESAQLLGSSLKEKHQLAPGTTFYLSQDCE